MKIYIERKMKNLIEIQLVMVNGESLGKQKFKYVIQMVTNVNPFNAKLS